MLKKLTVIFNLLFLFTSSAQAALWDNVEGKWTLYNNTYTDDSGNGNTLAATGTPVAADGHSGGTNYATLLERASSESLIITDAAQTGLDITGDITISAWVYLSTLLGPADYYIIINKYDASGTYSYSLQIEPDETIKFRLSGDGSTLVTCQSATSLSATTWYHVCGVYNGTDMRIYIDGSLDSNGADNPKTYSSGVYANSVDFRIGQTNSTHYFNGVIDDVIVYSRALSSIEVLTLSQLGDDFEFLAQISGTITDRLGNAIDCSTYNVRVNVYSKNNTSNPPVATTIVTSTDGTYTIPVPDTIEYTVCAEYDGVYAPTSETDILGAVFATGVAP